MNISDFIAAFAGSWLAGLDLPPWLLTSRAMDLVGDRVGQLGPDYHVADAVAVHRSATVETGAIVKGPAIVGPGSYVASGAYLRGGCWLQADCTVGPGSELKSAYLFEGAKLAHFNFVGDSLLGRDVNLEAGAIIANHRNEAPEAPLVLTVDGRLFETGLTKFGALVGDHAKVGANAVIAPGAVLPPRTLVARLALVDQAVGNR